ncbi:Kinesin-like protein [Actinidia chinensis var. chinensis]|uniref:Kinesin-like protein n=1 Tax=Actinidia chinensis var. chinensis TaxID=1590841 RepID=A0A2R6RFP6_ACTCC|nr:Kinesin-like protein [Actinidia chinensis var. chinensis]
MTTTEGILPFSVASVVEDVLQQHGKRLSDIDLASRKAEEASLRRYEAARWLRKTVGVVGGKDLPAEPSEEEFRLGLRSGIILCNAINKVQSGAIPKVVEAPSDSVIVPDGAALSAYQYFENVRNFLVAVEEMGLPTFEASDLEQGGKSSRIVNCVLALKSYDDWKRGGGNGLWKFGGNLKPITFGKYFVRKNSEPFISSLRNLTSEKSLDSISSEQSLCGDLGNDLNEMGNSHSLHMLVRELLSDKKPEEIPFIVENMIGKVMEEFEHRLVGQNEQMKTTLRDDDVSDPNKALSKSSLGDIEMEDGVSTTILKEECLNKEVIHNERSKNLVLKQQMLVERQCRDIQELKHTLHTTKADLHFLQIKYQEEVNNLGVHLRGLAYAASGYQRVLEENRKLYNHVQDLKGSIRVYCRVRPFLPGQPNSVSTVGHLDEGSISIITPLKYVKDGRKSFTFNKVFGPSATQEEVFSDTQPLIRSVLDGYNVCIFAYGQTGTGKTHTMTGPKELTQKSVGVNYRALSDLFLISEQRKNTISYEVSVQMIEIYNEQIRDLLATDGLNKRLEIRNSGQKGLNVPDANLVPVYSTDDVIYLMNLGQKNRAVGATAMNDRSSRSHSCLTVHVQGRELTSGTTLHGCMHLVDLAGSERVDKSEAVGDRLKEALHINKSLSALGDVISSLAQKNSHVPYRNSKLTQLLQDSLGGHAKTLMFVHISPEPDAVGETISTLKFAERVSTVELGAARANRDSADVKALKEQIANLKAALVKKEGEPGSLHSALSSTEIQSMNSAGSSPLHPSWQSSGDVSGGRRQQIEGIGNLEFRSNSSSTQKRQSINIQDLLMNSPPWPPVGSPASKEDVREAAGSGDWADKVMLNRQAGLGNDEDNRQLPEMFYQRHTPDPSKIYPEQSLNKFSGNRQDCQDNDVNRNRYETATTDDSDDLEAATSDSSETDLLWQLNLPKVSSIPNGLGSKTKKPNPKQTKSSEFRSLIPAPPTRRLSNGHISPLHKTGRQPVPVDGKRKIGIGN